MSIRDKILSRINEEISLNESVQLTKLNKDMQFAYKNLKKHLDKIGSRYRIKYDSESNSLEVAWGYDHYKDKKLLRKEDDLLRKAFYDKDFKEKKLKNVKVGFQADVSGYGIHDIY